MNEMIISNDSVCIKFMSGILNIRSFFIWFLFLSDRTLKTENQVTDIYILSPQDLKYNSL